MRYSRFNIMERSYVDLLAQALFEGDVVAGDFKVMPRADDLSEEESAKILYESMKRMGLIKDGYLVKIETA